MLLESVQLLCGASNEKGFTAPYFSTPVSQPCTLWVGEAYDNLRWFDTRRLALNKEYRWRFEKTKDHASVGITRQVEACQSSALGLTPFMQAMPDQYKKTNDPIAAYRRFYGVERSAFATWKKPEAPDWFVPESSSEVLML